DTSTSNLVRHVQTCKALVGKQPSIIAFTHGSTYSHGRLRYLLVKEVALCARPFAFAEDEPFREIVCMLMPNARLISANTLSKDVKEVYDITKAALPGRIHVVFDGWASGGKRSSQGLN
ncbi:hypothetical protein BDZ89DRAFT_902576, partial [Hymenopellis radicata]